MPLSYDEFVDKAANQTLTLGEAIDYAMAKPNTTENHFKQLRALRTAITQDKIGLSADLPFSEMRKEENYSRLFKSVNKSSNKLGNFQALELNIRPVLEESGVLGLTVPGPSGKGQIKVYPLITGGKGSGSLTGGAQRTELAGERPMRDLITQNDIEKLYSEAVPEIRSGFGDVAADVALYHKATFQRPEQILGDSAIKKSDVTITDDYVTIKGVTKGKKTRPTVKYPVGSEMADLIVRNYEATQSDKLFDIAPKVYDDAYRASISPRLVAGFEEALPLIDANDPSKGVVSTPSATRSFMVKIVTDELGYPDDVAEAMMGHTDSSILSKNYRGLKPLEGMGKIVDSLLMGVREGFAGFGDDASNFTSVLTEEERRDVAQAQVAEAKAKTEGYLSEAMQKQRERVAYLQSEEGQKFLEGQQSLAKQDIERKLELQAFEAEKRAEMKAASAPTVEVTTAELDDDMKKGMKSLANFFKGIGGNKLVQAGTAVGGTALVGASIAPRIAEAQEKIEAGQPVVPSVLEEAGQFVLEEGPVGMIQGGLEIGKEAVGAALEPAAKEMQRQAGEAGVKDNVEGQMSRMFGIPQ
jgi:hypothetical protein